MRLSTSIVDSSSADVRDGSFETDSEAKKRNLSARISKLGEYNSTVNITEIPFTSHQNPSTSTNIDAQQNDVGSMTTTGASEDDMVKTETGDKMSELAPVIAGVGALVAVSGYVLKLLAFGDRPTSNNAGEV